MSPLRRCARRQRSRSTSGRRCDSAAGSTAAAQGPSHVHEDRWHRERRATKRTAGERLARRSSRAELTSVSGMGGPASGVAGVRGDDLDRAQHTQRSGVREHRVSSSSGRVVLAQREGHQRPRTRTREGPLSQRLLAICCGQDARSPVPYFVQKSSLFSSVAANTLQGTDDVRPSATTPTSTSLRPDVPRSTTAARRAALPGQDGGGRLPVGQRVNL